MDKRHGGPYDRGSADSYYRRGMQPHYYVGTTYNSKCVSEEDMTEQQLQEYRQGYNDNEKAGDYKEYD